MQKWHTDHRKLCLTVKCKRKDFLQFCIVLNLNFDGNLKNFSPFKIRLTEYRSKSFFVSEGLSSDVNYIPMFLSFYLFYVFIKHHAIDLVNY